MWVQCIEMSKFSNDDFYGHRNMEEAIEAAHQGNSAARDLIARTVLKQYKRENPFDPRVPDHRKMEDLMNQYTEEYNENQRRSETPRQSYSEIVRGPKTPRGRSPTRQSIKDTAEENIAKMEDENKWYLGKILTENVLPTLRSFTPNPITKSIKTPGPASKDRILARKSNHTIVGRKFKPDKEGGSKKTRKSKKSSRRNRK